MGRQNGTLNRANGSAVPLAASSTNDAVDVIPEDAETKIRKRVPRESLKMVCDCAAPLALCTWLG
jgi:hypothetical protein